MSLESFAEARAHLRKAEDTSNLSSDDAEEQDSRLPRKRFARKRFHSTDEESDDGDEVEKKRPQLVKNPYPLPVTPKYSTPSQHFFIKSSCRPTTTTAAQFSLQENRTPPPRRESLDLLAIPTPSASASCTGKTLII